MKVDFSAPLITLAGKTVQDENENPVILGKLLGNYLVSSAKGDAIKFYDWAKAMYKGGVVDFDRADQELIKKTIKEAEQLTNLMKAQMLELFELKEKSDNVKSALESVNGEN